MDYQKSSLIVSLQDVEFAKDFHYFITVQLEGDPDKVNHFISCLTFLEKNRCFSSSEKSSLYFQRLRLATS